MAATARKHPRQARSKATVDAILEATARVLVDDGYDKLTTNRVAKVAGVSVGSLYQYFPNKQSLVLAVAEEHARSMVELLGATLSQLADVSIPVAIRTYVTAMLEVHSQEPELHHALVQVVMQVGFEPFEEVDEMAMTLITGFLEQHRDEVKPTNARAAAWVLMTSVESLTHLFALKRPEGVTEAMLAEEITAIVLRYLFGEVTECGVAAMGVSQ